MLMSVNVITVQPLPKTTRRRILKRAGKLAYASPLIVATAKLTAKSAEAFSF
jgi:hypothetical protein